MNWVTPFVQKTGCKVHVRTVRSSTELLDTVAHGRYDGVAAFGDVTQVLTGGRRGRAARPRSDPELPRRLPGAEDGCRRTSTAGRSSVCRTAAGPTCCSGARTSSARRRPAGSVLYDHRYAGRIGLYDAAVGLAPTRHPPRPAQPVRARPRPVPQGRPHRRRPVGRAGFYWQDLTNALADYTGGNAIVGEATPEARRPPAGGPGARRDGAAAGLDRALGLVDAARRRAPSELHVPLARLHRVGEGERRLCPLPHEAPATPAACAYMDCRAVHAARRVVVVGGCRSGDAAARLPRPRGARLRRLVRVVGRLGADPR